MLRRSSLTSAQRLSVLSSIGNSLAAEDVERGLRGAEDELRLHEKEGHPKGQGKHGRVHESSFWVEHEGEWGLTVFEDQDIEEMMETAEIHWQDSTRREGKGFLSAV